jgi:hypothetical protein
MKRFFVFLQNAAVRLPRPENRVFCAFLPVRGRLHFLMDMP